MPSYPGSVPTFSGILNSLRAFEFATPVADRLYGACWSPELGIYVICGNLYFGRGLFTSPDGINWTAQTTPLIDGNMYCICWSPELRLFVAAGNNFDSADFTCIITSPDGITWTARQAPASRKYNAICWSAELGLFCAVSVGNVVTTNIATSPDGIVWTARTAPSATEIYGVCWSPQLMMFVAVRQGTTGNRVITSPDGITWTARTTPEDNTWNNVCWSPELALFCAVSGNGTTRVMTSPDGINWTGRTAASAQVWKSVAWSPQKRLFVAVANSGAGDRMMYSSDGITWSSLVPPASREFYNICWSPERGNFAVVCTATDAVHIVGSDTVNVTEQNAINDEIEAIATEVGVQPRSISDIVQPEASPASVAQYLDMVANILKRMAGSSHWEAQTVDTGATPGRAICWSPELGMFAVIGDNLVYTSPDGKAWTGGSPLGGAYRCIAWSPSKGTFLGLINGSATYVRSGDGVSWIQVTGGFPPAVKGWCGICWAEELGIFVAVADSGVGQRVTTTPADLINLGFVFTARTTPADNNWKSVCWSPELNLLVAVASSGTGDRVMTSPDGITWTLRTSAADNNWTSVCWSPELSLFVAVAESGVGNRVMTSPDGLAWTIRTSAADNNWNSVAWSPELGMFMATAITGSGNRSMYSFDGINWTLLNTTADLNWYALCWSPELSLFCAVADSGTNRVQTYEELFRWHHAAGKGSGVIGEIVQTQRSAPNRIWSGIAWSPSLALFAAISQGGTGNRVMTSPDGITWTPRTSANDFVWQGIVWSVALSRFVAVSSSGATNRVMTSPDGITWTARAASQDNSWQNLAYAPSLTLFAAVSSDGTNRVMTSPDGITWTNRTAAAASPWKDVCWSAALSLFVAVANSEVSGTTRVMTSPDGINWTARTAPIGAWECVTWSPELGLFVALSGQSQSVPYPAYGWGARAMTSPDGINWTLRLMPIEGAVFWNDIEWSPELRLFVGVGQKPNASPYISQAPVNTVVEYTICYSADGINWTVAVGLTNQRMLGVAWAPALMKFAACGFTAGIASSATGTPFYTIELMHNSYNQPVPSRGLIGGHGNAATVAASATTFACLFDHTLNATEASARHVFPFACKLNIKTLRVQILTTQTANSGNNSGLRFHIKKNGVSTGIESEIPGGSTAGTYYPFYNLFDRYVNFAAGDTFVLEIRNGNTSVASAQIGAWTIEVDQIG